jgi:hypothetical protein
MVTQALSLAGGGEGFEAFPSRAPPNEREAQAGCTERSRGG